MFGSFRFGSVGRTAGEAVAGGAEGTSRVIEEVCVEVTGAPGAVEKVLTAMEANGVKRLGAVTGGAVNEGAAGGERAIASIVAATGFDDIGL